MPEYERKEINLKLIFGLILGAVILLIVLSYMFTALNVGATKVEIFAVIDPAVDQDVTLGFTPDAATLQVEQYNGAYWENIDPSYVTVNGKDVTVDADALYG